jgi:CRP-like cAMP-binding protein
VADEISASIRKLRSIGELSAADEDAVRTLPLRVVELARGADAAHDGSKPTESCLLVEGFMHRYKVLPNGRRQILAFHTPGDIPDLQSLHLRTLDHSLAATTRCTVGFIRHDDLRALIRKRPSVGDLLWRDTLIDAGMFRAWIVSMGQRPAPEHIAHLFCEMFVRLRAIGQTVDNACNLPLTQTELGDAVGLSTVHVNRTLQELRASNLIELQGGVLRILDWPRLKDLAQFDPTYLHLHDPKVAD